MGRELLGGLATCLIAGPALGQSGDVGSQKVVVIGANTYLFAGAAAIRAGQYDDGIRLTELGLKQDQPDQRNRAAGLANLCAAYVSKDEPDTAIPHCTESIRLNDQNWRAYSNRSHAYVLKGMYEEAARDNEAAAAINPDADHVVMIRGLINEHKLWPRVSVEDHQ